MNKKVKILVFVLFLISIIILASIYLNTVDVAVLNPKGEIAAKQRDLIIFTVLLSSVVVIPVFAMLAIFSWKYREGNKKAKYRPNWDSNKLLEVIWWGIPCIIIVILGVVTWRTTHELDPYKPLDSNVKPLNVQVVALQWKWLFIYPDQKIASVNLLQLPEDTPINFTITADSPMNSFWIPSLGGQVYAMSGMSTKLHLIANEVGDYRGSSANISGKGFADMTFTVRSSSKVDFDTWVNQTMQSLHELNLTTYNELAKPSTNKEPVYYALQDEGLYDTIVMKYMTPADHEHDNTTPNETIPEGHDHSNMNHMSEMEGM